MTAESQTTRQHADVSQSCNAKHTRTCQLERAVKTSQSTENCREWRSEVTVEKDEYYCTGDE